MALTHLQQQLQDIYELDVPHNVGDYLITNKIFADSLVADASFNLNRERLLVLEDKNDLSLSLYLHEEIIRKLHGGEALQIDHENLQDFCIALEGISHFLYLIWNVTFQRSVTRLEMEIQAEVDKFIMLIKYMRQQCAEPQPGQLRRILFETINFQKGLSATELQRYRDANAFAEKYCWYLESRSYFKDGRNGDLLKELRRFYRFNLGDKLRHINCLH